MCEEADCRACLTTTYFLKGDNKALTHTCVEEHKILDRLIMWFLCLKQETSVGQLSSSVVTELVTTLNPEHGSIISRSVTLMANERVTAIPMKEINASGFSSKTMNLERRRSSRCSTPQQL